MLDEHKNEGASNITVLSKTLDALHILFVYKVDYLTNVTKPGYVRCKVLSAGDYDFWESPVEKYRRSGETYCFHFQEGNLLWR